jgi:RNA polymerase sigma factor (sigma-70 family)
MSGWAMSERADHTGPDQTAGMVARYREPLMRYFTRRGFGPPICEDLAHDTFLKLFALKGSEHVDNAEAYLFHTAGSVLNDYLRKQKVRRTHQGMVQRIYASWFVGESPEHVLEGKQTFALFEKALGELKPRIRDIFLLSRVEGLTYTQIAVRLGVSVRTVEDDMARAVAHFVKRLRVPQ